jgi:hypothetical protein
MGWFQTATKGMTFNQSMTVPLELRLLTTVDGPRLTFTPVRELEALRAQSHRLGSLSLDHENFQKYCHVAWYLFRQHFSQHWYLTGPSPMLMQFRLTSERLACSSRLLRPGENCHSSLWWCLQQQQLRCFAQSN